MGRRELIALPGIAALAATHIFGQTQALTTAGAPGHVSKKSIGKHTGVKSAYKVPTGAKKQAKYVNSLGVLLALTQVQQQMAQTIFANAASIGASLQVNMKAARRALRDAVKNNDGNAINQAASALGAITGQRTANGALANAAFYQLLTPDQQAKLAQFQG